MNDILFLPLGELADVEISNIDKKSKETEKNVLLCNFTDVYNNWCISKEKANKFMKATASDNQISKFLLKKGQVLITKDSETRNDIGCSCYVSDDLDNVVLGYHCAVITPKKNVMKKIDGSYLNVVFHSEYLIKQLSNQASGSGQRYTLTLDSINSLKIPVIDYDKQILIGNLYEKIDKRIDYNEQITDDLLRITKIIYDYWFFQFNFPNDNGNAYLESGGLLKYNDDLKKNIPINWKSGLLGELFSSQSGFAFKSANWKKSGIPVLTIKSIQRDGKVDINCASYISASDYGNLEKYSAHNYNMIFAMSGNTIGKVGIIASNLDKIYINQRVLIIKTEANNIAYPYLILNDPKIQNNIYQLGANSAQPNISEKSLRNIKICIPERKVLEKFNTYCKPFFELIMNCYLDNDRLRKLMLDMIPKIIPVKK